MSDQPPKSPLDKIPPPPAIPGLPKIPGMPELPIPQPMAKPSLPNAARARPPVDFDENGFPKMPALPKKPGDLLKAPPPPPAPKLPPVELPKKG